MKFLLDTHAWLWFALDDARLPARVRRRLTGREPYALSPGSLVEVLMLDRRGRLELPVAASEWIASAIATGPFREVPITWAVAQATDRLRIATEDPFDRLIAATAKAYQLTLVTADRRLLDVDGIETLSARD